MITQLLTIKNQAGKIFSHSDSPSYNTVVFDSRKVVPGAMFVAIKGELSDGHNYIQKATEMGATVIVCEHIPSEINPNVSYFEVDDTHLALSILADNFYKSPSKQLKLVGVTGTNGKTTIATLLYELFMSMGYKVGLISTVVNKIAGTDVPTSHTTPDPMTINALLRDMVTAGCEYCFMEVSSHAVVQKRTASLQFVGGVFTNLTHDHLDYHKTFAEYLKAKKEFFDNLPKKVFAITNIDDRNGLVMTQNSRAKVITYSLRAMADFKTKIIEAHLDSMVLRIDNKDVWVQLIGRFNAYNITAIYAVARALGLCEEDILAKISELKSVSGRCQSLRSNSGILGVVDYAHTPDALKNVIDTLAEFKGKGRVLTVVGCGGDRDKTKRAVMASIAVDNSDVAIFTSDNPRTEEPTSILSDMTSGLRPEQLKRSLVIEDRAQAIRTAVMMAVSGDIVLVAGKGHESYQEVNGVRAHFDDLEQLTQAFE